jgi:hypothetical protein
MKHTLKPEAMKHTLKPEAMKHTLKATLKLLEDAGRCKQL